MIEVRLGTPNDVDEICRLLADFMFAENGEGPLNYAKGKKQVSALLENGVVFVAVCNGEIVGSIGLYEDSPWYSDARGLRDLWTFVHPDKRGARIATKLITAAKEVAVKQGLRLYLGILTPVKLEEKMKFYERLGLHLAGALYTGGK